MRQKALAILMALALGGPVVSRAAVLNVDDRRDDLPVAAFTTIGDAVAEADDGDTIVVWPGHYVENLDLRGRRLHVRSIDPRDEATVAATIVDGYYSGPVIQFRGDETSSTVVEGLYLTHGAGQNGGAIHGGNLGVGSAATIRFNIIEYNVANQYGGGIYRCSGPVQNNVFYENTASLGGGACAMCTGPITDNIIDSNDAERGGALFGCNGSIIKNVFTGNQATAGGAIWLTFGECAFNVFEGNTAATGGAISGGNGSIHDNIIRFNTADERGGGIDSSTGVIRANTLYKNVAANGGAIAGGTGEIGDNRILGNWASDSGGGLYQTAGTVRANLLDGNAADVAGGAAAGCSGTFEYNTIRSNLAPGGGALADCTGGTRYNRFQSNRADDGGALWRCTGRVLGNIFESNRALRGGAVNLCQGVLLHNTFAFNAATTGSAVWADGSVGLGVRGNIFYRGSGDAALGGQPFGGRYDALVTHNCFFGNDAVADMTAEALNGLHPAAAGNFTADPLLAAAAAPNPAPGSGPDNDYHLLAGSPCIDQGDWHVLAHLPVFDLDGLCRVEGRRPDLGCYERGARADSDGDGLDDATEKSFGTNPYGADTDGDGLSDGLEVAHETSPLDKDKGGVTIVPTNLPTAEDAVLFAFNNQRIVLNPGTYYSCLDFTGRTIAIQSRQPFLDGYPEATKIDALGLGPALTVQGLAAGGAVSILGVTIANGHADVGGAILAGTTQLTLQSCIVRDNVADTGGVIEGGGGTVEDCTFSGNSGLMGGCFSRFAGRFSGNNFTLNRAGWGAVFYACDPTTVTDNAMTSNTAVIYGGIAFESGGQFRGNVAVGNTAEQGGVLYRFGGPVLDNRFDGNRAKQGGVLFQCHGLVAGNAFTGNSARFGGAAYDSDGEIRNNAFRDNAADLHAGGLFECDGAILGNEFTGNHALDGGVLVFCSGSIQNNRFSGNWADGSGGAINTCGKTLSGNVFENNRAAQGGGAVSAFYGTVTGNTFRANGARSGGALALGEGTVEGNLFEANTAYSAGAIASYSGDIERNRFTGNSADYTAGAIGSSGGPIRNNLFVGNTAQHGGALQGCHRALIAFNTFAGNTASVAGGGVHDSAGATLINNIFTGNGTYAVIAYSASTSPTLIANNCFHDSGGGAYRNYDGRVLADAAALNAALPQASGNIDGDPRLVAADDLRLRPGSPCIDAGSVATDATADFDAVARPLDGNGDGAFIPDIGAYEFYGLRILSPASGATWQAGATVEVRWQAVAQWAGATVRFELWRGDRLVAVLGQAGGTGGTIRLLIPADLVGAADYRLRAVSLSDGTIVGENPAPIVIECKNAARDWVSYR